MILLVSYGYQVAKLLHKSDQTNPRKLRSALGNVAGMKRKPNDSKSPTSGERMRQGKLPGGTD
jgi:hypothetical protein